MASSGCAVLKDESERFVGYILADPRNRKRILDEDSFATVLEQSLRADPSLRNLVDDIKKRDSIKSCGKKIFEQPEIQRLLKENVVSKKKEISERTKRDRPDLSGNALKKEIQRRIKISFKLTGVKKLKQVSIDESLKPIKIRYFDERFNKTVQYRRSESRNLTIQERKLIVNGIRKGKKPAQIIQDYYSAGLKFRTQTSIRKHYYRLI